MYVLAILMQDYSCCRWLLNQKKLQFKLDHLQVGIIPFYTVTTRSNGTSSIFAAIHVHVASNNVFSRIDAIL